MNHADIPKKPKRLLCFSLKTPISQFPIIFIQECSSIDRLLTIDTNLLIGYHSFQSRDDDVPPFKFKPDNVSFELSKGQMESTMFSRLPSYGNTSNNKERRIGVPFAQPISLHHISSHSVNHNAASKGMRSQQKWIQMKSSTYEKIEKLKKVIATASTLSSPNPVNGNQSDNPKSNNTPPIINSTDNKQIRPNMPLSSSSSSSLSTMSAASAVKHSSATLTFTQNKITAKPARGRSYSDTAFLNAGSAKTASSLNNCSNTDDDLPAVISPVNISAKSPSNDINLDSLYDDEVLKKESISIAKESESFNRFSDASTFSQSLEVPTRKKLRLRTRSNAETDLEITLNSNSESLASLPYPTSLTSPTKHITNNLLINPIVSEPHVSSHLFGIIPELKLLFSVGHWDHSLRVTSLETGKLVQAVINQHSDVITCIAVAKDDFNAISKRYYVVTGSRDCTVLVWSNVGISNQSTLSAGGQIHNQTHHSSSLNLSDQYSSTSALPTSTKNDDTLPLNKNPHILYGHDNTVNAVAVVPALNMILSGSSDGTVIIHSLIDFVYIRSIVNFDNVAMFNSIASSINAQLVSSQSQSILLSASNSNLSNDKILSTSGYTPQLQESTGVPQPQTQSKNLNQNLPQKHYRSEITWIGVSVEYKHIITYSAAERKLCSFSINGVLLALKIVHENIYCFLFSEDGRVLLTGGDSCLVVMRWVS